MEYCLFFFSDIQKCNRGARLELMGLPGPAWRIYISRMNTQPTTASRDNNNYYLWLLLRLCIYFIYLNYGIFATLDIIIIVKREHIINKCTNGSRRTNILWVEEKNFWLVTMSREGLVNLAHLFFLIYIRRVYHSLLLLVIHLFWRWDAFFNRLSWIPWQCLTQ